MWCDVPVLNRKERGDGVVVVDPKKFLQEVMDGWNAIFSFFTSHLFLCDCDVIRQRLIDHDGRTEGRKIDQVGGYGTSYGRCKRK